MTCKSDLLLHDLLACPYSHSPSLQVVLDRGVDRTIGIVEGCFVGGWISGVEFCARIACFPGSVVNHVMCFVSVSLLSVAIVLAHLIRRHRAVGSLHPDDTMRNTEHEGTCDSLFTGDCSAGSNTFSVSLTISVHFSRVVAIHVVVESNSEIISSLSQLILLTQVLEMRKKSILDVPGVVSKAVILSDTHDFIACFEVTIAFFTVGVTAGATTGVAAGAAAGVTVRITVRATAIVAGFIVKMFNETLDLKVSNIG